MVGEGESSRTTSTVEIREKNSKLEGAEVIELAAPSIKTYVDAAASGGFSIRESERTHMPTEKRPSRTAVSSDAVNASLRRSAAEVNAVKDIRRDLNLCLRCGQSGHFSKKCKNLESYDQASVPDPVGQEPAPAVDVVKPEKESKLQRSSGLRDFVAPSWNHWSVITNVFLVELFIFACLIGYANSSSLPMQHPTLTRGQESLMDCHYFFVIPVCSGQSSLYGWRDYVPGLPDVGIDSITPTREGCLRLVAVFRLIGDMATLAFRPRMRVRYTYRGAYICVWCAAPIAKFCVESVGDYVRDLLSEGIEPNPGPGLNIWFDLPENETQPKVRHLGTKRNLNYYCCGMCESCMTNGYDVHLKCYVVDVGGRKMKFRCLTDAAVNMTNNLFESGHSFVRERMFRINTRHFLANVKISSKWKNSNSQPTWEPVNVLDLVLENAAAGWHQTVEDYSDDFQCADAPPLDRPTLSLLPSARDWPRSFMFAAVASALLLISFFITDLYSGLITQLWQGFFETLMFPVFYQGFVPGMIPVGYGRFINNLTSPGSSGFGLVWDAVFGSTGMVLQHLDVEPFLLARNTVPWYVWFLPMVALLLVLQWFCPDLIEVSEEFLTHSGPVLSKVAHILTVNGLPIVDSIGAGKVGLFVRFFIIAVETVRNVSSGYNMVIVIAMGFFHLLLQLMPLWISLPTHMFYNWFVSRYSTFRFTSQYEVTGLYTVEDGDDQDDDRRTYDSSVGVKEYENPIYNCTLHHSMGMFFDVPFRNNSIRIQIGSTTNVYKDVAFSPELASHLYSKRVSTMYTDTPEIIRARLESTVRSFTGLGEDRHVSDTRWAANTLEYVWRDIVSKNQNVGAQFPSRMYLYGAVLESILEFQKFPTEVASHQIYTRRPMDAAKKPLPVALQIFAAPGAYVKIDPNDPVTMIGGALKRVAVRMPDPDPAVLKRLVKFTKKFLKARKIQPIPPDCDLTFETWLESRPYPESRKVELRRVWRQFAGRLLRKHLKVKSFMKDEFYPEFKFPRWINSRSDVYKCYVGPVIAAIEKIVFSQPEFIKKVPCDERAGLVFDVLSSISGDLICSDYTSFEAVHRKVILDTVVRTVYMELTRANPLARQIIIKHLQVRSGTQRMATREFELHIENAILMSGEMDTSLNNGLFNLICMYFFASERCRAAGVPFDITKQYGFFEGDDGVCKFPAGCVPTEGDFTRVGAKCKVVYPDSLSTASFCGTVVDEASMTLVTDPKAWLSKFPYTSKMDCNSGEKRISDLLLAKAMAAAYQYNGCPVISPIAWSVIRKYRGNSIHKFVSENRSFGSWVREHTINAMNYVENHEEIKVSSSSRVLVERLYGISASEQIRLESVVPGLSRNDIYSVGYLQTPQQCRFFADYYGSQNSGPTNYINRRNLLLHRWHRPEISASLVKAVTWVNTRLRELWTRACFDLDLSLGKAPRSYASLVPRKSNLMNGTASLSEAEANLRKAQKFHAILTAASSRSRDSIGQRPQQPNGSAGKSPQPRPQQKAALQKRTQGGAVVARLGTQPSQKIRPTVGGASPRALGVPVKWNKNFITSEHTVADVPITHMAKIEHGLTHMEPKMERSGNGALLVGSEYITQVTLPAARSAGTPVLIPQGGVLASFPLNPLKIDGLRVSRQLSLFDQFRIKKLVIEYVPMVSALVPGGMVGAVIPDISTNPSLETGALVLRDLLSRPGAEINGVFTPSATRMNKQQQKWYYVDSNGDPSLEVPGLFLLVAATDFASDGLTASPFGILWMHYEIEARSDSFDLPAPLQLSAPGTYLLSFANVAELPLAGARVPTANTDLPASLLDRAVVFEFTVTDASEAAGMPGGPLWRQWGLPQSGKVITIVPGMRLYARCNDDNTFIVFFPSLWSAIAGQDGGYDELPSSGFEFSGTVASSAIIHALTVANVQAFSLAPRL